MIGPAQVPPVHEPPKPQQLWQGAASNSGILALLALALILLHTLTNGQYGFHRDELATLDDARHLVWSYVAYPPLTPAAWSWNCSEHR